MKLGRLVLFLLLIAACGGVWYWWSVTHSSALPAGIVSGNGRLEATQVSISTKEPGRVAEINVKEGDLVTPGQVLALMDTETLKAEMARMMSNLAESKAKVEVTLASIKRCESELQLAKLNFQRTSELFKKTVATKQDFDESKSSLETADAALKEEQAKMKTLTQSIEGATADVQRTQTRIDDSVLKSPVQGRVLYRLAEPGEVLGPGGKVLTVVNLADVYMEIYLPAQQAARVHIGADARITLDAAPGYAGQGTISFVSPEAQFTPKQVETRSERDKLMFRVKIQVPPERVLQYIERIKTGVRGVGYVRYDDKAVWPEALQKPFPAPPQRTEA